MAYTPPPITIDAQGNLFTSSGGKTVPAKIASLGRLIDLLLTHDCTIGQLEQRLLVTTNSIPKVDDVTIHLRNGVLVIDTISVMQLPVLPGPAVGSDLIVLTRDGIDYQAPLNLMPPKTT